MQDIRIEKILDSLSKSNFRSKFHLKPKDKDYIKEKGIEKIREHAYDFINKRLAKWHKIQKGIELNEEQKDYIINVIMSWIDREIKNS